MPCANIHLHLADQAWARWSEGALDRPFDLDEPGAREAFYHGALAPDWGYVPGVDRFYSELAHYVDTADLTRALLAAAEDPLQRAFAWGWATHVLGDIAIHPLVGMACGERLYGDRDLRLNSSADVETHVAIEIGLDIVFLGLRPAISPPPSRPYLRPANTGQLLRAFAGTYGLAWDAERLMADHRKAMRLTSGWRTALALVAGRRGMRNGGRVGVRARLTDATVGAVARVLGGGTPVAGFLSPMRPPDWLVEGVEAVSRGFPELVDEHVGGGLAGLANHNLETGVRDGTGVHHPDQAAVRRKLSSRQRS